MKTAIFVNKIWFLITIIISLQTSEYLFVHHIKHCYYERGLFICITCIGYSLGQTYSRRVYSIGTRFVNTDRQHACSLLQVSWIYNFYLNQT